MNKMLLGVVVLSLASASVSAMAKHVTIKFYNTTSGTNKLVQPLQGGKGFVQQPDGSYKVSVTRNHKFTGYLASTFGGGKVTVSKNGQLKVTTYKNKMFCLGSAVPPATPAYGRKAYASLRGITALNIYGKQTSSNCPK